MKNYPDMPMTRYEIELCIRADLARFGVTGLRAIDLFNLLERRYASYFTARDAERQRAEGGAS